MAQVALDLANLLIPIQFAVHTFLCSGHKRGIVRTRCQGCQGDGSAVMGRRGILSALLQHLLPAIPALQKGHAKVLASFGLPFLGGGLALLFLFPIFLL